MIVFTVPPYILQDVTNNKVFSFLTAFTSTSVQRDLLVSGQELTRPWLPSLWPRFWTILISLRGNPHQPPPCDTRDFICIWNRLLKIYFFNLNIFFNLKHKVLNFNLSADKLYTFDCLIKVFYWESFIET